MVSFDILLANARGKIELAKFRLINNEDKEYIAKALEDAMTDIDGLEGLLRLKGLIDQGESH